MKNNDYAAIQFGIAMTAGVAAGYDTWLKTAIIVAAVMISMDFVRWMKR